MRKKGVSFYILFFSLCSIIKFESHHFLSMTDQSFKYMLMLKLTCFLLNKIYSFVIYLKVQVLFQNRSWSTFSEGRCCIFTHIEATQLAQSLMRWKNPKGQIMFKWHFDDISLACLTFGELQFSCVLHLIHAEPFLIPSTTKHYFYDFSPISQQNPLDNCTRTHTCNTAAKQRESSDVNSLELDSSSLGTEIKSIRVFI